MRRRTLLLAGPLAVAALLSGCGGNEGLREAAPAPANGKDCPAAWRGGWQRLANQIGAVVYCPTWMPRPLDAKIGGAYANGRSVDKDRSYLVSFVWVDRDTGGITAEVHVNLRGYPGRTAIPPCQDTLTVNGKTVRKRVPCFADPRGTKRIADSTATLYAVNQGADQWHLLYAWHRNGSLYAISEHVTPPYSFRQVVQNLDRMLQGLVAIRPSV
jgi:hypothetical protein